MDQGQREWPKLMLRLPPDAKNWIAAEAAKHGASQNSEVIRSVRERMDRTKETAPNGASTPVRALAPQI